MTFRRPCRLKQSGFLLLDIILALTLTSVVIISTSLCLVQAQEIFDRASARQILINYYKLHAADFAGMMPYETRTGEHSESTSTVKIYYDSHARWYGNDRIETDVYLAYGKSSVDIISVRNYPFLIIDDSQGWPLCSVDYGSNITVRPIPLQIDPASPLTDVVIRNDIAYVSADPVTIADPDLYIFDLKNSALISSLNTGPGLSAVTLAGKHLYGSSVSTIGQLNVVDLENIYNPIFVKKWQIPLPATDTEPTRGSSIAYREKKVYLGTEKWDGRELNIIDVADPTEPSLIGGLETDSKINSIYVGREYSYVAASDKNQLWKLDLRNASAPQAVNLFNPDGYERSAGKALYYFEDSLAFGRTSGGFNITSQPELFNWVTSTSTEIMTRDVPGGVYGIVRDRNKIFLATRTLNEELLVMESTGSSTLETYSLPVAPQTMTCDNGSLFILARTAPIIYQIDFE